MPGFYRRTVGLLGFRCTVALLSFSLIGLVAIGLAADETGEADPRITFKLDIVREDFRAFWSACASMGVDNCGIAYPVDNSFRFADQPSTFLTFETDYPAWKSNNPDAFAPGSTLTTPVPYLKRLPADPFRDRSNYGYFKQPRPPRSLGVFGIVHSPGPDGIDDLSLKELRSRLKFYYSLFPEERNWEFRLPAGERAMLRAWIDPHLYDPTNGIDSRGDLIMVMHQTRYGFGVKAEEAAEWLAVQPSTAAFDEAVNNLANLPRDAEWRLRPGASASIPVELLAVLRQTGVVDDMKTTPTVNQDRLNELKNRLGGIPNFFDELALTNLQQQEGLDQWRADDPRWWEGMRSLPPGRQSVQSVSVPISEIYPTLVIYGRSQLLQAAREINAGNKEIAARRLSALDETFESIRGQTPFEKQELYARNVHRSLGAMIGRMKVKMKTEEN